jgi:hypothetical protein
MGADEAWVSFIPQGLSVGRLFTNEAEARDAATFLVDGDDGFDLRKVSQVINQLPYLLGALNVPAKQNVATRLELAEALGCLRLQDGTGDTSEEQLGKKLGIGWHGAEK